MTTRSGTRLAALAVAVLFYAGCADSFPEQDLRVRDAAPVARLSTGLLWDDYQKDTTDADSRYRGRVILVTGPVTSVGPVDVGQRFVMFGGGKDPGGVRANLLDEGALAVLDEIKTAPGVRLTLKCRCTGLVGTAVVLSSCVKQ